MGKGKAKGWRPPRAGDAGTALMGGVDHLSGNSIASPVQLRQEGIAMPENHMNFGEEWMPGKGGKGTGSWQRTKAPPPKAEPQAPMQPTAKGKAPAPSPKESALPKAAPKAVPGGSSASSAPGSAGAAAQQEVKKEVKQEVKTEVKQEVKKEVKTEAKLEADDGLTEIERRRRALQMLQTAQPEVKEEVKEELEEEEDAGEPPSKRPCTGDERPAQATNAMQQGLQGWATRVNALAEEDAELVNKCRDFVRARILRAHAEGNLHDINWEEEPVPTVEEVAGS